MRPKQKVTHFATNSARCATQKNPDEIVHRGHLSGSKSNTQPSSEGRKQKFKLNQRNLFRPHSRCLRMPAHYLSLGPLGKTRIKANDPQCKLLRPGPKIRQSEGRRKNAEGRNISRINAWSVAGIQVVCECLPITCPSVRLLPFSFFLFPSWTRYGSAASSKV